jgi:hypothetical protein
MSAAWPVRERGLRWPAGCRREPGYGRIARATPPAVHVPEADAWKTDSIQVLRFAARPSRNPFEKSGNGVIGSLGVQPWHRARESYLNCFTFRRRRRSHQIATNHRRVGALGAESCAAVRGRVMAAHRMRTVLYHPVRAICSERGMAALHRPQREQRYRPSLPRCFFDALLGVIVMTHVLEKARDRSRLFAASEPAPFL